MNSLLTRPSIFTRVGLRPIQQIKTYIINTKASKPVDVYSPLKEQKKKVLDVFKQKQYERLDPTGWRRALFSKSNKEQVRTGDIVRVLYTTRAIPSFVGQVIAISRKNLDASLVLRNQINKVGVELKVKLFSPLVSRIDIIRRPHKYRARNRQYYIRGTKLDVGDLETSLKKRR